MKSFLKIVMLFTVIGFVVGCTKYERDNPNDLKNTTQGTANIEFTRYEVKSDDNSDGLIQKNETVVLNLYFKNNGTNLTDAIGSVFQMPPNSQVVSNSFNYYNNTRCYVGKEALLATVTLKLSSSLTPGQILTMPYTITDINLGKHRGEIKVKIDGFSSSQLVITAINVLPTDFTFGAQPIVSISVKNNSSTPYDGTVKTSLISNNTSYPYTSIDLNNKSLKLNVGESSNLYCTFNCMDKSFYNNQNIDFSLKLTDIFTRNSEIKFTQKMALSAKKINFINPIIEDVFSPGEFFSINIDLENVGLEDIDLSSIEVTTTTNYISNMSAKFLTSRILSGITYPIVINIRGFLDSSCPLLTDITFNVKLLSDNKCGSDEFVYSFYGTVQ